MISSLKGVANRIRGSEVEIMVGGIGYEVFMGKKSFSEGEEVMVSTYMAVSENEIRLFGFENYEDLSLFKMMITVSGVGPKTAAGILAEKNGVEIMKAIGDADVDFFKKIKGIGLKTAQRIIVDLKSKIGGLGELNLKSAFAKATADEEDDVVLSLKQLGFDNKEIERVMSKLPSELVELEEKISWCLENIK